MFGGINVNLNGIDPQQMEQMQQCQQICKEHPKCNGCPLYTTSGYNGVFCENALVKLSAQSGQTSS